MNQAIEHDQVQSCPQCDRHCPADALRCGRGRRYFGAEDSGHSHKHGHGRLGRLLHRCGRFAHHARLEEDELFQALTAEEKDVLRGLLEKLAADWQAKFGKKALSRHHGRGSKKHHHKHEGHSK